MLDDPAPMTVTADDGVSLHAEVQGDPDAPVTVVLSHGYLLNADSWSHQRAVLARHARVVTWDHRGHGRSARGSLHQLTIDQLGRDLRAVLERTAPSGPVVLVGHSMGGMAMLALAEQHPELFGTRIVGTALVATASGPIRPGFGLPPQSAASLAWAAQRVVTLAQRVSFPVPTRWRRVARETVRWLIGRCASAQASSAAEAQLGGMIEPTSMEVVLTLLPEFVRLDKSAALPILGHTATLVLGAGGDAITSPEHSKTIAAGVPGAKLVVLDGAGHHVHFEEPHQVNPYLQELLTRVTPRTTAPGPSAAA